MTINELKLKIENKEPVDSLLIFVYSDTDFVPVQYSKQLGKNSNLQVLGIDELPEQSQVTDLFDIAPENLRIYRTDCFDSKLDYTQEKNLIILCKKVDKSLIPLYNDYIINFPKLVDWNIKDYVYSLLYPSIPTNQLDYLISVCGDNLYRLQMEIERLLIFPRDVRNTLIDNFNSDELYSDLTNTTVFNITNALLQRNINDLKMYYSDLNKLDTNPMGFLAILYQAFKNIINIQLNSTSTPESCGLSKNQYWAIKNSSTGFYNKDELAKIFLLISNVDKQIKLGEFPIDKLIDYLILSIMSI